MNLVCQQFIPAEVPAPTPSFFTQFFVQTVLVFAGFILGRKLTARMLQRGLLEMKERVINHHYFRSAFLMAYILLASVEHYYLQTQVNKTHHKPINFQQLIFIGA